MHFSFTLSYSTQLLSLKKFKSDFTNTNKKIKIEMETMCKFIHFCNLISLLIALDKIHKAPLFEFD
jgi:hypothetical protein